MIIKSYELEKKRLDQNIYLLYGDNEGYKEEIIKGILQKFNFKKFTYFEKDILNDKENFFNLLFSKSFFETEKIVLIKDVSDKMFDIINDIKKKGLEGVILILETNVLEKKSKIRNLFEKEKDLICVPFYPDEFRNLNYIAQNFLKNKNLKISQESINLIIERSNGSRNHLKKELEKIYTYALNKKEIGFSEILKLTNLSKNYNISELVEMCLVKNHNKLSKIINENNFSNDDTILIIRTFLLKAKRLLKLSKNLEKEKSLETVISNYKPPIFWKDKEIVKQQLKLWKKESLKKLIYEVNLTELQIKKNISLSLNILLNFIFKNSKTINN